MHYFRTYISIFQNHNQQTFLPNNMIKLFYLNSRIGIIEYDRFSLIIRKVGWATAMLSFSPD